MDWFFLANVVDVVVRVVVVVEAQRRADRKHDHVRVEAAALLVDGHRLGGDLALRAGHLDREHDVLDAAVVADEQRVVLLVQAAVCAVLASGGGLLVHHEVGLRRGALAVPQDVTGDRADLVALDFGGAGAERGGGQQDGIEDHVASVRQLRTVARSRL
jgi:hypothetical protein